MSAGGAASILCVLYGFFDKNVSMTSKEYKSRKMEKDEKFFFFDDYINIKIHGFIDNHIKFHGFIDNSYKYKYSYYVPI
jgi:hypothetical protein